MKDKKTKLVYVKCLDMTGIDFWATKEDLDKLELSTVELVGWLYSRNDDIVKIVATIGHRQFDDGEDHYAHVHIIPKKLIIEMKELRFENETS